MDESEKDILECAADWLQATGELFLALAAGANRVLDEIEDREGMDDDNS